MKNFLNRYSDHLLTQRVSIALGVLVIVFLVGALGYHLIEDISYFNAFYLTFITITTIGFSELTELSVAGRVLTMVIFVMGIGVISYIASQWTQLLFESKIFKQKAMQKKLDNLEQHYIIAGYGRIGRRIANVLRKAKIPLVVIDHDEEIIEDVKKAGLLYVKGNAQEEGILKQAGISRAKGLIGTLSRDQDNIFVTLTGRDLNPNLFILTRTYEHKNRKKILRAGANKVISPYEIGADRMANAVLRPNVDQFMERILGGAMQDYIFDEVKISEGSELSGKTLLDAQIRQKYSVVIIAIIPKEDNEIQFNPGGDDTLAEGDSLILIGNFNHIKTFREEACKDFRSLEKRVSNYDFIKHTNLQKATTSV